MKILNAPRKLREKLTGYQALINISNILEKIFLTTLVSTALLFWVWSRDGIGIGGISIATIFFITLILFFLNRKGYPRLAGNLLFVTISIVLAYLAIHEDGIYNVPFVFFPILLIFAGIIYGKKMVATYTGVIAGLTTLLFALDRIGIIMPFDGSVTWSPDYYAIALVILIATGVILHLVMGKIEHNLEQIVLSEKSIKKAYELTIESWARALELGQRETSGHTQRIMTLMKEFTRELQIDAALEGEIIRGTLLHDIGKMGVPDSILRKPGKLTEEELDICKQHIQYSINILQNIPYLQTAMDIPLYHHEQWDGKGYPNNLAEEQIPLPARLFAIVDNWDSLTNKQVYRDAWSKDKTITYLQDQINKKFDGKLVGTFLGIIEQPK